jgi:fucose permease
VERDMSYSFNCSRRLIRLAQAGFLFIGIANTLLGPLLPSLSWRWKLDDAQAGYLFTAQFAGALIGSACSGAMIRWLGYRYILAAGYLLLSVVIACLAVSVFSVGLLCIFGLGLGLGLVNPATNLLIALHASSRRAAALNLLNLVWGLGAVTGPWLIAILTRDEQYSTPLFVLAGLLFGTGACIFWTREPPLASEREPDSPASPKSPTAQAWLDPFVLLTGVLVFVYVGTETSASGWLAAYVQRLGSEAKVSWAISVSLFWAGLISGRGAAPLFLRRVSEASLILLTLPVALIGLVIILLCRNVMAVSIGAGITGFGLAPIFPTVFAIFAERLAERAAQLSWCVFVMSSLGGAMLPWLVGYVSNRRGDLRMGLLVPLLGIVVMMGLQLVLNRRRDRQPE